ncbi:CHAT domain-containing protein [Oscillatoria sp. FACHB-1407]|uniref:CHAT domain-containing protein n=1 Tax=Oscillatoria sp. FACHB-1407 TaxID=2692847 RepID=UPI00168A0FA6|nr:CHAT domain-containing protein [Oscillatoria sp. FACHB-1407]MBD2463573.1 CHAT domain-containing protein [Oscillatoria sp. FACHB-1407]
MNWRAIIQKLFSSKARRQFLQVALLGLLISVSLHVGIAVGLQEIGHWQTENVESSAISSSPVDSSVSSPAVQLMQQAETYYHAGQVSQAIALWQQAALHYETEDDSLNQALTLSFLATAFADQGQWAPANEAIARSIALLNAPGLNSNPNTSTVRAQVLTVQGELQLTQGQASTALKTWQQAETAYRQTHDTSGILGSQINQARALQSEGLYRRATTLLTQIEQSLHNQPNSWLKVTGLRNLGKMLRLVGSLPQSRAVLEESLAIALQLQDNSPESATNISGILLSLGNTTRAQGEIDSALAFYQQAAATAPSATTKTQVQLVQFSLLVEADRLTDVQQVLPGLQSQITNLPPGRLAVYARINLAQSLIKWGNKQTELAAKGSFDFSALAQDLATAISQARSMGDRRAESYALGTLGSLYEITHQWDSAKTLTQEALRIAQSIDAPDVTYQWQWQLGRIFCHNTQPCAAAGDVQNATVAYGEAVKTLQSLRHDLVAINQEVQFSFREGVEPVYRQFVELLLHSPLTPPSEGGGAKPSQENLKQAREVIEALQLAELDNFFREACLNARPVEIDQIDPHAAVIYPIILPTQFAVIVGLPNQPLRYYKTSLPQTEVERILTQLYDSLRPTAFLEDWMPAAQQVYNLLLRPVETQLAASNIKTLVFVPDGLLRNIPMAVLHDGQHYLIENYAVVLTPGLQLLQPQPLTQMRLQGLLAGVSQARENFPPLPNVSVEIDQIRAEIPSQVLLDQSFTNDSFQTRVDSTPSSIVHLATHGQFSSNADDTFILTWDGRINVKQLDQLLQTREGNLNPIELLVLSACQTAEGDDRAALGMAGVAVRSGARSTLASLWSVSDRSTALLMIEFYHQLAQPGMTKAEALRRAQVSLLQQDDYMIPYYWAPFVLLGNWL